MEKLLAMHVAAQLTQAACGNVGGALPVDATLADNGVRAKNLQVWETFRVFYRGVTGALADNTSWPPPAIDAGNLFKSLPDGIAGLITSPPVKDLLGKLLSAIPAPPLAPKGPLPDPGAK